MAEGFLRAELDNQGARFSVASAGIEDLFGRAAHKHAINVMRKMNVDISGHESRLATTRMLQSSDLVIGMTRDHVRKIVEQDVGLFPKTFTIGELSRRSNGVPIGVEDGLRSWASLIHGNRVVSDLRGSFDPEDVKDPLGKAKREFRRTATRLKELTSEIAAILVDERV